MLCGLFLYALALSCNRMNVKEYVAFIKNSDNGLCKIVNNGEWKYTIQYRPYDYILLSEQLNDKEKEYRLKDLQGTAWFTVSFENDSSKESALRVNANSIEIYNERLNYFLNKASNDIRLVYDQKDTLSPETYVFENNYNLVMHETILVGFRLPGNPVKPDKDMQIIYVDKVFQNGIIKAIISQKSLSNIPHLVI